MITRPREVDKRCLSSYTFFYACVWERAFRSPLENRSSAALAAVLYGRVTEEDERFLPQRVAVFSW